MPVRPSVWIVTPDLHRQGGTERCLAEQIDRLKERFDITVFAMRIEDIDRAGFHVRMIPDPRIPQLFRWVWWVFANRVVRWRLSRREGRPDAVYSPGINCLDADAITVHIVFLKHWEFVRSQTVADLRSPRTALRAFHRIVYWKLLHAFERRVYGGRASLACLSKWDAAYLEQRFPLRESGGIQVIPHGVDHEHFSPEGVASQRSAARQALGIKPSQRLVMLFGNDLYKKGIDVAVRAIPLLPDDVILGLRGGFDAAPLNDLIDPSLLRERVRIIPAADDALERYAAADLIIQPSREDSFALPPLEAMACGIPVVVSAKAGVAELVTDGVDGLVLVDPEDVDDLADKISAILTNGELKERLIAGGLVLAHALSWEENARRTGDMIERTMRLQGPGVG